MQTCAAPTLFLLWLASPSHDLCSQYEMTPLILASLKGHPTVVEALLKAGADFNAADTVRLFRIR